MALGACKQVSEIFLPLSLSVQKRNWLLFLRLEINCGKVRPPEDTELCEGTCTGMQKLRAKPHSSSHSCTPGEG